MAHFPIRKTEILGLGESIITGLTNNAAIYPVPPVVPADLQTAFDGTIAACETAVAAQAAALQATTDKIQRRQRPEGPWTDAGMAMDTEATLHSQARGKEWEYRVLAVNKAGKGEPSNTVMAVL